MVRKYDIRSIITIMVGVRVRVTEWDNIRCSVRSPCMEAARSVLGRRVTNACVNSMQTNYSSRFQ